MEGWKVGRLEGCKVGRLEGWKVGRNMTYQGTENSLIDCEAKKNKNTNKYPVSLSSLFLWGVIEA